MVDIPIKEQVIPRSYEGRRIKRSKAIQLLNGSIGRRKQINGLTFDLEELPTSSSNKNWSTVIRRPVPFNKKTSQHAHRIKNATTTDIYVHYLGDDDVKHCIKDLVQYYLLNHSSVRTIDGESGTMKPAGMRVDYRTSTITSYKHFGNKAISDRVFEDGLVEFRKLIQSSCCAKSYELEMDALEECGNFRTILEQSILPTMVVSENLTNSMHCDTNDDARSFSLFYPILPNAQTLFLFPTIGLCIDISSPVIICWDGRVAQHGSYTTTPGIHSLFGGAMKNVGV